MTSDSAVIGGHASELALRTRIREFLDKELPRPQRYGTGLVGGPGYMEFAPEFSRKLAEHGWLGMAIPPEYGGQGRGHLERFVVIEELLAAGAPLVAHWVADRQTAPMLLAFGTPEQRRRLLPLAAAGDLHVALGFSEPDSGSDLASVRTRAAKVDGGWSISGTKTWTSGAHTNNYCITLCRTSDSDDKHRGLSLLLVDLKAPGVEVRPILFPDGGHRFNEVFFDNVFVPDDMLLGEPGSGWELMNSELSHERAGPERFMAVWPLFEAYLTLSRKNAAENADRIGQISSRFYALRQLAVSVAWGLQRDQVSSMSVSILKDLGTSFEQDTVAELQAIVQRDPDPTSGGVFDALLARALVMAPSWTLTGGTTEVLRSVAARSLRGPRTRTAGAGNGPASELEDVVDQLFAERNDPQARQRAEATGWPQECWDAVAAAGLQWVGVSESIGGSGGTLQDAATLVRLAGRHAVALPLAECTMLGGWLLESAGIQVPDGPISVVAPDDARHVTIDQQLRISGRLERVPWARQVTRVVALVDQSDGPAVVVVDPRQATIQPGFNVAGEPRDTVILDGVALPQADVVRVSPGHGVELRLRGALSRALLLAGAAQAVADMTVTYANQRRQFGREIIRFQAVSQRLVQLVSEAELAELTAVAAARRFAEIGVAAEFEIAAAKVTAARAAGAVAAHAHQLHGAMGMTQEYPLHHFTRRLWAWRQEWGTEQYWSRRAGERTLATADDQLFPLIVSGGLA
ncbi:acyl-CoA dehydrogenase family protein [Dactylosporangium sp. CA-092794]|uniref:acyl-CoA dehydrogenase family protein n=1 Tax=Dactylosporangium sp. CA-092794 TaxID=3239929 RepID=UPI003D940B58